MLSDILTHIGNDNIISCEAQEQILNALIPDKNYLHYSGYLYYNYCKRAKIYVEKGDYESAVQCLQKSLEYAIANDNADKKNTTYRFTSPFFDHCEYNPDNFYRTGGSSQVEDFYEYIKDKPFDKLHNREDFKKHFNI